MKFVVRKQKENTANLARKLEYRPIETKEGELVCVRYLGTSGYPRFHLYIKENKEELVLNLHLDQKKPSYSGSPAHSGEYEGEVVEKEAERIKKILGEFT